MMTQQQTSLRSTFRITQVLVGMLLLFLMVQGVMLWRVCRSGSKSTRRLADGAIPSMTHVAALKENLNLYRLRSYELMFVQEKDRAAKTAEVEALHRQNVDLIKKLDKLFPAGEGKELLTRLDSDLQTYAASVAQLRVTMEKDFEGAMKILDQQIPPQVTQLNEGVTKFSNYCSTLASGQIEQTITSFGSIQNTAVGFGILSIVFALIVASVVTLNSGRLQRRLGELVRDLTEGSCRVNESGKSLTSASQSLAEAASEQAAALEETSASLEEMSSMTKRNADNSSAANQLAKHAREAAETGANNMKAMSQAMNDIKTSSDDIAKIIRTIDEIAFQTNILALNAAVEAARAGEAGMGFAVVADEVRNLAQRSAQAAKDTASKIEGAIGRISQGVDINARVGEALGDIVAKVRQVDELVTEVAIASKEQSHGITQVNAAVTQMDRITQNNAASAEESASAARELDSQAIAMQNSVSELLHLVGGGNAKKPVGGIEDPVRESPSTPPAAEAGSPMRKNRAIPSPVPASTANSRREEIPLSTNFKDF